MNNLEDTCEDAERIGGLLYECKREEFCEYQRHYLPAKYCSKEKLRKVSKGKK